MESTAYSPDQARALIRHYYESEWRSSRLDVLKTLGRYQDSRSFQFLVEIIQKNEDLAEQQLAVLALSQRKSSHSARFLRHFYAKAPDTLRAHIAYAMGQVHDESATEILLKDFDAAIVKQDFFWLRNIILSLGELKAFAALPKIRRLLAEQGVTDPSVMMALLFAIGRLERDAAFLITQESKFFEDSLQYQIFQAALSQIQVRNQFKLEDYLSKVFTLADPHPVLPLELRAFDESEVEMGIELFDIATHWKRTLLALRGVRPERRVSYYQKILSYIRAQAEQMAATHQPSLGHEDYFWNFLKFDCAHQSILNFAIQNRPKSTNLNWFECCAEKLDWKKELPLFFSAQGPEADSQAILVLNIWNEWAWLQPKSQLLDSFEVWLPLGLSKPVYARLIRSAAELGVGNKSLVQRWTKDLQLPDLRGSALLALEKFPEWVEIDEFVKLVSGWPDSEKETYSTRVLAVMEAFASRLTREQVAAKSAVDSLLNLFAQSASLEVRAGVLKFLRVQALSPFEPYVLDHVNHQNANVELNAVIALKSYSDSAVSSEALIEKLKSASAVVRGRALDALCAHASLTAKRGVIQFLQENIQDEVIVDKVYRSFDPQKKGGPEFAKKVDQLILDHPDHVQWEKLVQLRDRLSVVAEKPAAETKKTTGTQKSEVLQGVDKSLIEVIPHFLKLDFMAQSALRAAEEPFRATEEMRNLPIDKAPTVLEYCKALDLILEKYLGQKILFPKLETSLHDFQTVWHKIGFIEDYPSADKVMNALGVKGKMNPEHFPLHKAKMMAATFFNGKIVQDRFKVFDGLRAWAVIFLVFARKLPASTGAVGPLLKLPHANDDECISVAKRLMVLQDLRNPAAHRQTYTDMSTVLVFRTEAIQLLNTVLKFLETNTKDKS